MYNDVSMIYKIINDMQIEFNLGEIEIIECDMFACVPEDKIIYIAKEKDEYEIAGEKFLESYIQDKFGLKIPQDKMYIFSTLHEIGHIITFPNIDQERYWQEIKEVPEDDFLAHREIYGEYVADVWAINYIINNKKILN